MGNNDDAFGAIQGHLAEPRLRQYVVAAGGDHDKALELYTWNTRLAAALFVDLGHLEVALRNALDARMTERHARLARSATWLDDPTGELGRDLRSSGRPRHHAPYRDIASARSRVSSNGKPLDHGQILSETSFGLWHQLVSKRFTTTLWPDLAGAFPYAPNRTRATVADPISDLRELRNRIGHHHRVWPLPCGLRHAQLLDVAGYIAPELRSWIAANTTVTALLAASPLDDIRAS